MKQKTGGGKPSMSEREARLKAALKQNLARRKAQAKARSDKQQTPSENKE